ncbi:hypothetical protein HRI_003587300 [Hibiscus trionum]|uniref:RRM domain-containing protein n=1 Tax=Hibiscus trionum TaxID=183268 RepID=A0A9W7IN61_HIBTR|nr:hypothetical protein HRI_003587300 [Hibiscus trionum]
MEERRFGGSRPARRFEAVQKNQTRGAEWTIFVDNVSRRVSRHALRDIFSNFGRVCRVFIPLRNEKPKYKYVTFAFVSMEKQEEMERAIQKTDRIKLDGFVIRSSKARFMRNKVHENFASGSHGGVHRKTTYMEQHTDRSEKLKGKVYGDTFPPGGNSKSYRQVVLENPISAEEGKKDADGVSSREGINPKSKNIKDFQAPTNAIIWMKQCLAGVIKESFDSEFVQRALLNDDIGVKISKWGVNNDYVVIHFESVEMMNQILATKKDELCYWFDHIGPLLIDEIPFYFCTLELSGIPLYCWYDNFFEEIGNRWGKFICIDAMTKNKDQLDVARIIIRAVSPSTFPEFITLSSMGYIFRIKIRCVSRSQGQSEQKSGSGDEGNEDIWASSDSEESFQGPVDNPPTAHRRQSNNSPVNDGSEKTVHSQPGAVPIPQEKIVIKNPKSQGGTDVNVGITRDFNVVAVNSWVESDNMGEEQDICHNGLSSVVAGNSRIGPALTKPDNFLSPIHGTNSPIINHGPYVNIDDQVAPSGTDVHGEGLKFSVDIMSLTHLKALVWINLLTLHPLLSFDRITLQFVHCCLVLRVYSEPKTEDF